MQMKYKLIISAVSIALFFTACSNTKVQESLSSIKKEQEIKEEAIKAIQTLGGTFQKVLNTKVKEGGLTNAANFCSTNASSLEKEISKTLDKGVKVRRITSKARNQANSANSEELIVLEEIKEKLENAQNVDLIIKKKSINHYKVYKPILISAKCLNCHGNDKQRDLESYNIILKKYPNDKAINYKSGDLRGAFLVDIIK